MAEHLPKVKQQGQGIGQQADHGPDHQGRILVSRGVLEVAVHGEGLKDLGINLPAAARQLAPTGRGWSKNSGGINPNSRLLAQQLVVTSSTVCRCRRRPPSSSVITTRRRWQRRTVLSTLTLRSAAGQYNWGQYQ